MVVLLRIGYYIMLVVMFFTGTFGYNIRSQKTKLDLSDYKLVWSDEFNSNKLDTTTWNVGSNQRRGGYWDGSQVFLKGGNLVIRTEYLENGTFGSGFYTGEVSTKKQWCKGYFEMRAIQLKATGAWSAFWLMCDGATDETKGGKNGAEIDIVESPYSTSAFAKERVQSAICYDGYGANYVRSTAAMPKVTTGDGSIYETYHTYGCMWTDNEYIFYIDGVETGRTSLGGISEVMEQIVLSGEVGGSGGVPGSDWAFVGKTTDKHLCTDFIIDYARVYQVK
jgi:beta-glucanase (GH16 family)